MPVIRTYRCNDCGELFEVVLESGNDGDPPCPYCEKALTWQPGMFAIKTNKSRALDLTQKIVEQDYGLTDMKDNLREGDVAAKSPPMTTAEREAKEKVERDISQLAMNPERMHPLAKTFFGGPQTGPFAAQNLSVKSVIQNAKGAVPADRHPMNMLAEAGRKGQLPTNYTLVNEHGKEIRVRK